MTRDVTPPTHLDGMPVVRTAHSFEILQGHIDDAIGFSLRGYYAPELDELRGRGLERRRLDVDRRQQPGDRRTAARRD